MISFFISLAVLIGGYFLYSRLTEKVFAPDGRNTPSFVDNDGVDFMPVKTWKAFLIQLLNIAGTGPIFGALMGAVFGPVVFLWIVLGSLLGGAVHDYMSGMISCRHKGASIAELSGKYLGKPVLYIMRIFSIVLLILVGTVFITSPATLLASLTGGVPFFSSTFWLIIIVVYYILATLLPIDKIISKLYPIFGIVLMIMAVGVIGGIIIGGYSIPEISFTNMNPNGLPVWPFMFVTVACGAISGFHATQSPMMAKCIKREKDGKPVFYGAMISEGVIALIWAAAGVAFYGGTQALNSALGSLGQSGVVMDISQTLLGPVGGVLAIIGVVVCPLTSGDTAFRSARLILAEWTGLDQKNIWKRLVLTIPLLGVGAGLTFIDFQIIWRYFAWSNQTLAMLALWVASAYLIKRGKYKYGSLITALPATFMSAVSLTYILMAPEGFRLSAVIGYSCGGVFAGLCFAFYLFWLLKKRVLNKDFVRELDPVYEVPVAECEEGENGVVAEVAAESAVQEDEKEGEDI